MATDSRDQEDESVLSSGSKRTARGLSLPLGTRSSFYARRGKPSEFTASGKFLRPREYGGRRRLGLNFASKAQSARPRPRAPADFAGAVGCSAPQSPRPLLAH